MIDLESVQESLREGRKRITKSRWQLVSGFVLMILSGILLTFSLAIVSTIFFGLEIMQYGLKTVIITGIILGILVNLINWKLSGMAKATRDVKLNISRVEESLAQLKLEKEIEKA